MEKVVFLGDKEEAPANAVFVDAFESGVEELFFINNPYLKKIMPEAKAPLEDFMKNNKIDPVWIYFPWKNTVVKTLPEELYFKLRTSRNRNIILEAEQEAYRNLKVAVAGLSVGSGIISSLVATGGPKILKIADFDTIEITNLNRIKATLLDIGSNKTDVAARQILELDPFARLFLYDKGINKENIEEFILGGKDSPRTDIFIDEMDSLDLKIMARFICKKNGIPVLMATDNGDGIILDIERFDIEPDRSIFHGLVDMKEEDLKNLNFKAWLKLATQIVGPDYLTERMQDSLLEIGKSLPSVPQLGSTAAVAGGAIAFSARRIANKAEMPSGRYLMGLEEKLITKYNEPEAKQMRDEKTKEFMNKFGKQ